MCLLSAPVATNHLRNKLLGLLIIFTKFNECCARKEWFAWKVWCSVVIQQMPS